MARKMTLKDKIEYKVTKKKNKEMRGYAPNPFSKISDGTLVGDVSAKTVNRVTEPVFHKYAWWRATKGKNGYKKGVDSPTKGSNLYNKHYFGAKKVAKIIVGIIVTITAGGSIISFLMLDTIGKIKFGAGISFIVLIFYLISKFIKKIFGK